MNSTTVIIGALFVIYGIVSTIMWFVKPSSHGKLAAMKQRYGEQTGAVMHFASYCIAPMVCGIIFIIKGLLGGEF